MKWLPFALLILSASTPVDAADLVVLVRHAEKADVPAADPRAKDPELSPAGRERAESLASMLKDMNLTAVFSTDYKRTRETAEPVAKRFGLTVQVYDPKDVADLVDRVKAAAGAVLVVGHSNTIPEALKTLGLPHEVTIPETEFDSLFIVDRANTAEPTFIRLRYR
jgi:phosphohistidine phosphatase SixA